MAAKEMDWLASVVTAMVPVSCSGKNPLGTTKYNSTVISSVARNTAQVSGRWSSTQSSQRP
ncbi:hypothetical protein D3C81_1900750 [compost metagenome]